MKTRRMKRPIGVNPERLYLVKEAAKILGVDPSSFYKVLERYGIDKVDNRVPGEDIITIYKLWTQETTSQTTSN